MRIRVIVAAGMVLALAGCQSPAEKKREALLTMVRAKLETELLDYPSSRIRNVRVLKAGETLCGEVNSKNRMGAYSGWTPFMNVGPELIIMTGDTVEANPCPGAQYELEFQTGDFATRLQP